MWKATLYIIGNGFDLYHGVSSRYSDFKNYLKNEDSFLLEKLENYFDVSTLWSEFEATLGKLNSEQIFRECFPFLDDPYNFSYEEEVKKRIETITVGLKKRFAEWINQLIIPNDDTFQKLPLTKTNSFFLNFNYTKTLEKIYNINSKKILYLHNKIESGVSSPILGHSKKIKSLSASKKFENATGIWITSRSRIESKDVWLERGNQLVKGYFEDFYKSTEAIIAENEQTFKCFYPMTDIYILGHSLSKVDLLYFKKIVNSIHKKTVNWYISFYRKEERNHHFKVIKSLGITAAKISLDTLENLFKDNL